MGRVASQSCEKIVLTADNSRSESTEDIINDIKSGISSEAECYVIEDRKKAIEFVFNRLFLFVYLYQLLFVHLFAEFVNFVGSEIFVEIHIFVDNTIWSEFDDAIAYC